jgi:anti-anti-sigma factor
MEIKTEQFEGGVSVSVIGRLDSVSSTTLEQYLLPLVSSEPRLALDLSGVEYVSSAGLRVLLLMTKTGKRTSCNFIVCGVRSNIHEVIKLSGFDAILSIKPTIKDVFA